MKSKALKISFSVCLSVIAISCLGLYFFIAVSNQEKESHLLEVANKVVNNNVIIGVDGSQEEEVFSVNEVEKHEDIIGKIIIPKINVEAPIKEGTTQEVLKEAVGHFSNTNYWNGNVALASHNRGTYAHYFENINKLNINDEIIYQTKAGTRKYKVVNIKEIQEDDLSVLNNTNNNCITLITCIKNKKEMRLCVKASEII